MAQFSKLTVWYLDDEQLAQLSAFADRTMVLQATFRTAVSGYLTLRIIWKFI
jgi:uncharacterized protein YaeQ